MPRPKYRITPEDEPFARRWIEKKLADPRWLGERTHAAWAAYHALPPWDAEALNRWAEAWLSSAEWTRMKNAIRQARRRARHPEVVNVQITRYAWRILQFWARRDGCTLSEVIERRLGGRR
ncbi:MAG: hypothetical protein D6771_03185 [Zetaproteobacteria bacterium]|nr:MAG: hypothetical protein D6771_03185 [Zetaproteobacteria bacterium]